MLDKFSLIVISPEILLLVAACVIALVDLGVKSRLRDLTYWLTMATLALVAWFTADYARPCTRSTRWWSATPWATGSSASPLWP